MRTALAIVTLSLLWGSPLSAAPILEYAFDEGSGAVATNTGSLGAGFNGAIVGATYTSDTPGPGSSHALAFNGDHRVSIPDYSLTGSALTVEAWVKPTDVSGQRALLDDYGSPGVFFAITSGYVQLSLTTSDTATQGVSVFAGSVTAGEWQHVAASYDGAALRAYVNGVEVGSTPLTGTIVDGVSDLPTIGRDDVSNALNYQGALDDFRLHTAVLGSQELAGGAFAVPEPGALSLAALALLSLVLGRRPRTLPR